MGNEKNDKNAGVKALVGFAVFFFAVSFALAAIDAVFSAHEIFLAANTYDVLGRRASSYRSWESAILCIFMMGLDAFIVLRLFSAIKAFGFSKAAALSLEKILINRRALGTMAVSAFLIIMLTYAVESDLERLLIPVSTVALLLGFGTVWRFAQVLKNR